MRNNDKGNELTFLQTLGSVLAAFGGVQNMKNLRRDFHSNSAWKIIVAGLVITIIFVTTIIFVARSAAS